MSGDLKIALRARLDQNYKDFLDQLQGKTAYELIAMAPEITAARQLHEELLDACDQDDMEFLLRFDDPLEVVRGYWESEVTGYDHSGEMGHMLWEIRDKEMYPKDQLAHEQQSISPISKDEIGIDPVMDFSGREIIAYAEIYFDVGKRFQVYPNIDDTCDLYAKYDPVSRTLRGELCIKDYDCNEQWQSVEFMPSEQETVIGLMEKACQKDTGKSLLDTWMECHPAINRKKLHEKKTGRSQHER